MMKLLSTARAMDDQTFRWRVMGACIQFAAGFRDMPAGPAREHALRVLANPHDVHPMMLALVASNPVIASAVDVDEHGAVSTHAVPDTDIEFVVAEAWPLVAAQYVSEPTG